MDVSSFVGCSRGTSKLALNPNTGKSFLRRAKVGWMPSVVPNAGCRCPRAGHLFSFSVRRSPRRLNLSVRFKSRPCRYFQSATLRELPIRTQQFRLRCRFARLGTVRAVLTGALLLVSSGCAVRSSSIYPADARARPAADTPIRFMVGTMPSGGALTEPVAGASCRNPMVDPRDGTQLRLVQSQSADSGYVGDYAVPNERYGARIGELLRLNCSTGEAIGFVPSRG